MNRDELSRAVTAACAHPGEPHLVVVGSQAILGSYDDTDAATRSREVDDDRRTTVLRGLH